MKLPRRSYIAKPNALIHTVSDMANISTGWDVDGIISPSESVSGMLQVIETKDVRHNGTFWTWEGKVNLSMSISV